MKTAGTLCFALKAAGDGISFIAWSSGELRLSFARAIKNRAFAARS
jgi:hypothetical protein